VAAKSAIHEIIRDLAKRGIAILLISDEVHEVFHNCNRIFVMHKGRFIAEFDAAQTSLEAIQNLINAST
jgi:simple sugar transport system ATP-binding protein